MIRFKPSYSRQVLIQLDIFALLLILVMLFNLDFLSAVYIENQQTNTGIIINAGIIVLFLLGLGNIIYNLSHYLKEEQALAQFISNLNINQASLAPPVNEHSLIMHRFKAMNDIAGQKSAINQSALASAMIAHESTRLSLSRFISNILILCGVFGTIVSLSVALLGASNLLGSNNDVSAMGDVIHGMSTALSTTTTAIVCYLFFGYFFHRLSDVQTHLFSAIEQVSTQYLMPRFNHSPDDVMLELNDLVKTLNKTIGNMHVAQQYFLQASQKSEHLIEQYDNRMQGLSQDVRQIKYLLQTGFRLPEAMVAEEPGARQETKQTQPQTFEQAGEQSAEPIPDNSFHSDNRF